MTGDRNFLTYWRALERASAGSLPGAPTLAEASLTFAAGEPHLAALEIIAAARAIQAAVRDGLMAENPKRRIVRPYNQWN